MVSWSISEKARNRRLCAVSRRQELVERARLERVTSYTEMNTVVAQRTGIRKFDFDQESDRAAMGHLLPRWWLSVGVPSADRVVHGCGHDNAEDPGDVGSAEYVGEWSGVKGLVDEGDLDAQADEVGEEACQPHPPYRPRG
jgi:hypothetical protein